MNARRSRNPFPALATLLLVAAPAIGFSQVPVDENGKPIGSYESQQATGNEDIPLLSITELESLVGPVALYPDDLLAIVLPASTYPLQVIEAGRFLDALEQDPSLRPDEDWDDSVVALTNYPEVVELLNDDLDWTWRLGEAVVAQQADIVAAVESFRNRAYAAGNLQSDSHQTVSRSEGAITISPVEEDVIYVPYYEPERVVVYQPQPVYHYYPRPCPVYYYPYPSSYDFHRGYFWGVTTAFSIGWRTDRVHVIHHSYHGHPYYSRYYRDYWWYRRPSIVIHNTVYANNRVTVSRHRYRNGDYWRPRHETRRRLSDQRIVRSRYYSSEGNRSVSRSVQGRTHSLAPQTRQTQRTQHSRRQASTSQNRSIERSGSINRRAPTATRQRHDGTTTRAPSRTSRTITTERPERSLERQRSVPVQRQAGSNRQGPTSTPPPHRQTVERQPPPQTRQPAPVTRSAPQRRADAAERRSSRQSSRQSPRQSPRQSQQQTSTPRSERPSRETRSSGSHQRGREAGRRR